MLKVRKVLNNNALLAVDTTTLEEIIFIGNGVGFNQKINMEFTPRPTDAIYRQEKNMDIALKLSKNDPIFLEIASSILEDAKAVFQTIDNNILLSLSDHIAFAIERIKNQLVISNPFAHDIELLFAEEYEIAKRSQQMIYEKTGIMIHEEEVGYITLHIHSARSDEKVSEGMLFAVIVNESIRQIEATLHVEIDVHSLAYSRLLTHMKYMIARAKTHEQLSIDMDQFTKSQFPLAYEISEEIIRKVEHAINLPIETIEVGYLALHIQRVCSL